MANITFNVDTKFFISKLDVESTINGPVLEVEIIQMQHVETYHIMKFINPHQIVMEIIEKVKSEYPKNIYIDAMQFSILRDHAFDMESSCASYPPQAYVAGDQYYGPYGKYPGASAVTNTDDIGSQGIFIPDETMDDITDAAADLAVMHGIDLNKKDVKVSIKPKKSKPTMDSEYKPRIIEI